MPSLVIFSHEVVVAVDTVEVVGPLFSKENPLEHRSGEDFFNFLPGSSVTSNESLSRSDPKTSIAFEAKTHPPPVARPLGQGREVPRPPRRTGRPRNRWPHSRFRLGKPRYRRPTVRNPGTEPIRSPPSEHRRPILVKGQEIDLVISTRPDPQPLVPLVRIGGMPLFAIEIDEVAVPQRNPDLPVFLDRDRIDARTAASGRV